MRARTWHAACSCGAVRFLVDAVPRDGVPCICARCRGQGVRMAAADRATFRLLAGEDGLTEQIEDAQRPHHFFCRRCGEATFGFGPGGTVRVNVACLPRGDVEGIAVAGHVVTRKKAWEA